MVDDNRGNHRPTQLKAAVPEAEQAAAELEALRSRHGCGSQPEPRPENLGRRPPLKATTPSTREERDRVNDALLQYARRVQQEVEVVRAVEELDRLPPGRVSTIPQSQRRRADPPGEDRNRFEPDDYPAPDLSASGTANDAWSGVALTRSRLEGQVRTMTVAEPRLERPPRVGQRLDGVRGIDSTGRLPVGPATHESKIGDQLATPFSGLPVLPVTPIQLTKTVGGLGAPPAPRRPTTIGNGRAWGMRVIAGVDLQTLRDDLVDLAKFGFRPATISAHTVNTKIRYSATLIADEEVDFRWEVEFYYTFAAVYGALDTRWKESTHPDPERPAWRPLYVSGAAATGEGKYVIIWIKDDWAATWGFRWNYFVGLFAHPSSSFLAAKQTYAEKGYRPLAVTIESPSQHAPTVGVFVKDNIPPDETDVSFLYGIDALSKTLPELTLSHHRPVCIDAGPSLFTVITVSDDPSELVSAPFKSRGSVVNWLGSTEDPGSVLKSGWVPVAFIQHSEDWFGFVLRRLEQPVATVVGTDGDKVPVQPGVFDDLDVLVFDQMVDQSATAATLAIYYRGIPLLRRGYTFLVEGYPLTQPNSICRVASCSKPITALATVALLQDLGWSVNHEAFSPDEFQDYLPAELVSKGLEPPTVRHLLQHTAGWWRSTVPPPLPSKKDGVLDVTKSHAKFILEKLGGSSEWSGSWPMTRTDLVNFLFESKYFPTQKEVGVVIFIFGVEVYDFWLLDTWYGLPLNMDLTGYFPGKNQQYSNLGYTLLAQFIEAALGAPSGRDYPFANYRKWVTARVLEPLGLSQTHGGRSARFRKHRWEMLYPTNLEDGLDFWFPKGWGQNTDGWKGGMVTEDLGKRTRLYGRVDGDAQTPGYPLARSELHVTGAKPPDADHAPPQGTYQWKAYRPMELRSGDAGWCMSADDMAKFCSTFDQLEYVNKQGLQTEASLPNTLWTGVLLDAQGEELLNKFYVHAMLNPQTPVDHPAVNDLKDAALGFSRGTLDLDLPKGASSLPKLKAELPKPPQPLQPYKVAVLSHSGLLNAKSYYAHREDKVNIGFAENNASGGSSGTFFTALHVAANVLLYK